MRHAVLKVLVLRTHDKEKGEKKKKRKKKDEYRVWSVARDTEGRFISELHRTTYCSAEFSEFLAGTCSIPATARMLKCRLSSVLFVMLR